MGGMKPRKWRPHKSLIHWQQHDLSQPTQVLWLKKSIKIHMTNTLKEVLTYKIDTTDNSVERPPHTFSFWYLCGEIRMRMNSHQSPHEVIPFISWNRKKEIGTRVIEQRKYWCRAIICCRPIVDNVSQAPAWLIDSRYSGHKNVRPHIHTVKHNKTH